MTDRDYSPYKSGGQSSPFAGMGDWRVIVGNNVRALRLARGMTQERLAFAAELDLTYIGGIERGRRNPSLLVMARIAIALDATIAELVTLPRE